ncbi:MAG TPA: RNA polymerase sigma factor [Allosphingosinicella sp.]|nr:RNA polymerase sigma factor [Allosphingosinicella sp.]
MSLTGPEGAARPAPDDAADTVRVAGSEGPDKDAGIAELYRVESPKLIRLFTRRTRNRDDADDLVQDVFFRFARLKGAMDALEKPQAYLRRIAANLLKDRSRSAARNAASSHVPADEGMLVAADQQRALEARDMLRRLDAAIAKLKPKTREIFLAHRVEGLNYSEIAERTGLSVKGVEKQMSKAILQLDRLLSRSRQG